MVLIEDLHWIDVASEEFIETLADAVVGTATLLVVNFRPGFTAAFMQHTHFRQIVIPPLERTDAERLLREHFGEDPSLGPLTRNIIERAQGNPFFIEELATAIAERGDFEGERGAYRLKHGVDTIPLPATVQAVVAARIDHLEEMAKQVLETAAVIGRLVAMSILRPVAALSNDELLEAQAGGTAVRFAALRSGIARVSPSADPGGDLCDAIAIAPDRAARLGRENHRILRLGKARRVCRPSCLSLRGGRPDAGSRHPFAPCRSLDRQDEFLAGSCRVEKGALATAGSA